MRINSIGDIAKPEEVGLFCVDSQPATQLNLGCPRSMVLLHRVD